MLSNHSTPSRLGRSGLPLAVSLIAHQDTDALESLLEPASSSLGKTGIFALLNCLCFLSAFSQTLLYGGV